MTLAEKIQDLRNELEQSSSQQYKDAVRSQLDRLEYWQRHGHYPGQKNES